LAALLASRFARAGRIFNREADERALRAACRR